MESFYPYVTDNLFRLLKKGSNSLWPDLSKDAKDAVKKTQVGLPNSAALNVLFGSTAMDQCVNKHKSYINDATERTIFRLFWPFEYQKPLEETYGFGDLQALIRLSVASQPFKDENRLYRTQLFKDENRLYTTQLYFLRHWFLFLTESNLDSLNSAFCKFRELMTDAKCALLLKTILQNEYVSEDEATNSVAMALNKTVSCLLEQSSNRAMEKLREGNIENAGRILVAVRDSGFAPSIVHQVLRERVLPSAERLYHQVLASALEIVDTFKVKKWSPEWEPADIAKVSQLHLLAVTLPDSVFETQSFDAKCWHDAVVAYSDAVGNAMRNYAIGIANEENDYRQAVTICLKIQSLLISDSLKSFLVSDLRILNNNLESQTSSISSSQLAEKPLAKNLIEQYPDLLEATKSNPRPIECAEAMEELKSIIFDASRYLITPDLAKIKLLILRRRWSRSDFVFSSDPWFGRLRSLTRTSGYENGLDDYLTDMVRLERSRKL